MRVATVRSILCKAQEHDKSFNIITNIPYKRNDSFEGVGLGCKYYRSDEYTDSFGYTHHFESMDIDDNYLHLSLNVVRENGITYKKDVYLKYDSIDCIEVFDQYGYTSAI